MAALRHAPAMDTVTDLPITIRMAYPEDASALRRLAELDSAAVPDEPLMVGGRRRDSGGRVDVRPEHDRRPLRSHRSCRGPRSRSHPPERPYVRSAPAPALKALSGSVPPGRLRPSR